jgi:hypothetical protein
MLRIWVVETDVIVTAFTELTVDDALAGGYRSDAAHGLPLVISGGAFRQDAVVFDILVTCRRGKKTVPEKCACQPDRLKKVRIFEVAHRSCRAELSARAPFCLTVYFTESIVT